MIQEIKKSTRRSQQGSIEAGPAIVLALSRKQHHNFAPLYGYAGFKVIKTADWRPEIVRDTRPDLLLTTSCDSFEKAACIEEARRLDIPSLLVMDGTIEWHHQWENPRFAAGGGTLYNQLVATDKIACLGRQSARTFEAWSNVGKCEIVGAPRFDSYLNEPITFKAHDGPQRLLVMTANTPGFTPEHVAIVERSLLDVQGYLTNQSEWEPIWRVGRGLDDEGLGLVDRFPHLRGRPLHEVFAEADAVLTTPSTVILESMLVRLPTAIMDYANSPHYVSAAWTVTSPEHLGPTLQDLLDPPARRLALQDDILHDCLECYTPATPRMVRLIEEMIQIGQEARAARKPPEFPARILPVEFGGHVLPSEHFDLAKLYPNHPVFANRDLQALQLELTHARQELEQLRREVQLRRVGYWVSVIGRKIHRVLQRKRTA